MIDKNFCMSSYLAFRYIEREGMDFFENTRHENFIPIAEEQRISVKSCEDIDAVIKDVFDNIKEQRLGIMLSGGMDSAILASYMEGHDAYTFRFLGGSYQTEELMRAEYYANKYNLKLHYVDISWETVVENLMPVILQKGAPVHSIEPQIYQAAIQAKNDGIERMIVGESADLIFGGMDGLLSKDWSVEEFKERYIFTKPELVLKEPVDMSYLFEKYRQGDKIDFLSFMDNVFSIESSSSYMNAFASAGMAYTDPYAQMKMVDKLDLQRVRKGESKYLVRDLFRMKYLDYPIPEKIPMPRPVDEYFKNWTGPTRKEFKEDINMMQFSGNQKWQLYCLEKFLHVFEKE